MDENTREILTIDDFKARMKAQGVPLEHVAFICPACATIQSATSLIRAMDNNRMDLPPGLRRKSDVLEIRHVEKFLGFSCVGRWTGAGPAPAIGQSSDGTGCDWTLGGLFHLHKIEIEMPEGAKRPVFELATPEQAAALMAEHLAQPTTEKA